MKPELVDEEDVMETEKRRKIGVVLMVVGAVLLLAAAGPIANFAGEMAFAPILVAASVFLAGYGLLTDKRPPEARRARRPYDYEVHR